ncbi:MAG: hypothetical protein GVY06_09885 [Alphaproteobacteria bacterium]|nr:hypothetical protein [Alphaproteobacteria bacterium]
MLFATPSLALDKIADWRWPHFAATELACNCAGRYCTGRYWHDPAFLDALEDLRARAGHRPLIISSGHRCAQWNAAVGGAPRSLHKTIAADILLSGHDRERLEAAARAAGFTGIGLAARFIHLDRRARPARWTYA